LGTSANPVWVNMLHKFVQNFKNINLQSSRPLCYNYIIRACNLEIQKGFDFMNKNFAPMNMAGVFDRVMHVYAKSFGKQMAFSAIAGILTSIVFSMAGALVAIVIALLFFVSDGMTSIIFSVAIVVILATLWFSLFNAGAVLLSKTAFYETKIKLPINQLPIATLRVCTAFLAQLLIFIPVILASGFFYTRVLFGIINNFNFTASGVITFIILSLIVFIAYLMLENIFAVTMAVATFEGRWFFGAVIRSWELIKHDFWKVLIARFLWIIATLCMFYAAFGVLILFMLLNYWLMDTFGAWAIDSFEIMAMVIYSIVSVIIGFAMFPLNGILQSVIYYNQRIKHEALDIEIMIEQAETELAEMQKE